MNQNIDETKQNEVVKSIDEAKESFSSYSKVLDFQNIDRIKETNNFASFYALNKLSNQLENRASINSNHQSMHILQKYKKQKIVRKTLFYIYMIMTIFQRPGWCNFEEYQEYCTVHPDFKIPTMINFYLPINFYYCLEIMIVLYLSFSKAIKSSILGNDTRKKISIVLIIQTSVIIINDVIVMITENNYNYNISLLMKPIFVVLYKSQLQSIILNYCSIINRGKEIYYLMIFSLLFFAGLGSAIFQDHDQEQVSNQICKIDQPPFSQPDKCIVIILFVLQTTVNSPDIYLPYYEQSRPYVFYFITFQFINTALIINFVLAFFYSSYKELMEEKTNQILSLHNQRLSRIASKFFRKRTMSDITQIAEIDSLENEIQLVMFKLLDNKYYEFFIEFLCLISFFTIFSQINQIKLYILLSINGILLIESLVLLYFNGKRRILKNKTILLEVLVSMTIIFLIILNILNNSYLKYLLILLCYRLLRGCKWLLKNEKFTNLIISISQISSFIVQLFGTLFILFMLFTAIGQLFFGGKINYSNANASHYELANFNDFLSGMCTCWFLLIINNWNVISYNYAQIFDTDLVYFYFISFYIIVVLFALNVTMALLIEYIVQQINHKKQQSTQEPQEPQDEIKYE